MPRKPITWLSKCNKTIKIQSHYYITVENQLIIREQNIKFLGLVIDENFNWKATTMNWQLTSNCLSDHRFAVSPCVPTLPYAPRSTLQAVSTRVWYSTALRDHKFCQHSSDAISPRSRYVTLHCFLYFCISVMK